MAEVDKELNNKYLDRSGVESLWGAFLTRLDKKIDSVSNADETVQVFDKRKIAVKISSSEDNILRVKKGKGEEGLYVPVSHKLRFGADYEFEYDGTKDVNVPVYAGGYTE